MISEPRYVQQLTIPEEIVSQFYMAGGLTVERLEHVATGKGHKYKPAHWHDFVKEATKPWKAPRPKAFEYKPWMDEAGLTKWSVN